MLEAEKRGLDSPARRFAVAVAVIVAVFLLRQMVVLRFGLELPAFFTFYPAVMLLALYFGLWSGVVATILAAALAGYWILPPIGQFKIARASDALILTLFIVIGICMSLVAERYRRFQRRAVVSEKQQALRKTEERYRKLFTSMNAGFCVIEMTFDSHGKPVDYLYLEVNDAFERATGISRAAGRRIREIAPELEEHWFEIYGRIAMTGEPEHFTNEARELNRCFEVYAYRVDDPEQRHVAVIFDDITERRRAEEALNESRTKLEAAMASMTDAVFISDTEGRFIDFNDAFATFHKFQSKAECGETVAEFQKILEVLAANGEPIPPDMWGVPRALRGETVTNVEYTLRRKDTGETWIGSYSFAPIRDKGGAIVGSVVTARDITERKRAEVTLRESERSLRESQRIAGLGTFVLDLRTGEWKRSEMLEELFGIDSSYDHTMAGWMALIHPEDRVMVENHLTVDVIGSGQPFMKDYRIIRPVDQAVRWIHGQRRLEFDAAGKPAILRSTTQDITEQKLAEDRLRLAASVFSHATEGIMITAPDGVILDVNDAFSRITGYTRAEVLGRNPSLLNSGRQDRDFYEEMWSTLIEKGEWSGEIWNRTKNGETYSASQTITAVLGADGNIRQYVALFHDNTQLKQHELRLEQIAYFDALTGLPNRILLSDRLRRAMIQTHRRQRLLAVALLDLDGFKSVNDGHGHDAGDRLLSALAVRMKHALREGDTLARLGGDEFVAVLPDLGTVGASVPIITRLLEAAAEPVEIGGSTLRVSASVGVTFYPQGEEQDADQLLRQADQAMYQAKVTSRNSYQFFDSAQGRSAASRMEKLDSIRRAMTAQEFVLYYQPKVNMSTGEVVGAEALIRWQQPGGELLLPAEFLPVVQDHPLAVELSEWVIDTALDQMESWQAGGLEIPVSVNVGAQHLLEDRFVEHLRARLAAHPRVRPSSLELEVLESSALKDIVLVSKILDACHKVGVSIALDDFGSGYSSLTYLKLLPADVLKIDQSFVRESVSKAENQAILEAMLGLAAALHRQIIAEGVETIDHGLMLLQTGYELAQGYAIAHPMRASELPGWSAAWRPDRRWMKVGSAKREAAVPGESWSH
jgi:diguanylate cyclase (GGDEF)-like protein/PAS domain S-box-containing protein